MRESCARSISTRAVRSSNSRSGVWRANRSRRGGPAGDISAAVRNATEARITYTDAAKKVSAEAQERANKLQAAAKALYEDANERILTTANNVQSRLKAIEDRLATGDFLKEQIICVLQDFQILSEDSNVGALVKFHIEEAVRAAKGEQPLAEQFGHLVPKH